MVIQYLNKMCCSCIWLVHCYASPIKCTSNEHELCVCAGGCDVMQDGGGAILPRLPAGRVSTPLCAHYLCLNQCYANAFVVVLFR